MPWERRPSIAGTAAAGLFLTLTLVTSAAHAEARLVNGRASIPPHRDATRVRA